MPSSNRWMNRLDPKSRIRKRGESDMQRVQRYVGLDVHKHYVMVAAVNGEQEVVLQPQRVGLDKFPRWLQHHLTGADCIALEATSNAWLLYDVLAPHVA